MEEKSMPFDETLAERIRRTLERRRGITEKKMFGGLAFLVGGKMFCGVTGVKLMVRVGPENYERALNRPHASPMDFTGKPLTGYVYVRKNGLQRTRELERWVNEGLDFTRSLLRSKL